MRRMDDTKGVIFLVRFDFFRLAYYQRLSKLFTILVSSPSAQDSPAAWFDAAEIASIFHHTQNVSTSQQPLAISNDSLFFVMVRPIGMPRVSFKARRTRHVSRHEDNLRRRQSVKTSFQHLLPIVSSMDEIYVSPLSRAQETLSILRQHAAPGMLPPTETVLSELREIDLFGWEGQRITDLKETDAHVYQAWKVGDAQSFVVNGRLPIVETWRRAETVWNIIRGQCQQQQQQERAACAVCRVQCNFRIKDKYRHQVHYWCVMVLWVKPCYALPLDGTNVTFVNTNFPTVAWWRLYGTIRRMTCDKLEMALSRTNGTIASYSRYNVGIEYYD